MIPLAESERLSAMSLQLPAVAPWLVFASESPGCSVQRPGIRYGIT